MREKVLFDEKFASFEINSSGIITGYNKSAAELIADLYGVSPSENMEGSPVTDIFKNNGEVSFDHTSPWRLLSAVKGLKFIDSIYYKETDSVIVRVVSSGEIFYPFFDAVKLSSSLYLILDSSLEVLFASESFLQSSGKDRSVLYGFNISTLTDKSGSCKIDSAAKLCRDEILDSIKIDDIMFVFNGMMRFLDIEIFPVWTSGDKEFSGIICHLLDSSSEKKLVKMNRTVRRMSAIANFAGGIAHDYNNALTAVLGNISLAKMDADKNSELAELLRDAECAGLKIKALTERLGLFARGMKPAKTGTDVKKLIEGILPEVLSYYKGELRLNVHDRMPQPEVDPELIGDALRHIIENAVDATDHSGGEIIIEAAEIEITEESVFRETSLVPGKYIVISIADNGTGFDPRLSPEMFDPYVTTKPGREGLGLALAYTILKRHRGYISVSNADNGGAVFKVHLPLF